MQAKARQVACGAVGFMTTEPAEGCPQHRAGGAGENRVGQSVPRGLRRGSAKCNRELRRTFPELQAVAVGASTRTPWKGLSLLVCARTLPCGHSVKKTQREHHERTRLRFLVILLSFFLVANRSERRVIRSVESAGDRAARESAAKVACKVLTCSVCCVMSS